MAFQKTKARRNVRVTMTKSITYGRLEVVKNLALFLKRRIKGIVSLTYPAKISWMNLWWRAKRPTNFTGKVCFKILNDRNPLITVFCDKIAVRTYVEFRIGKKYLPKLYWEGIKLENQTYEILPEEFVVKSTHSSGGSVIVSNKCNSKNVLPAIPYFSEWRSYAIHPQNINPNHLFKLASYWTKRSFYNFPGKLPEWGYRDVVARILIEECLFGSNDELPDDYKFFMFGGRCNLIYKFSNRFGRSTIDLFDSEWNRIEGSYLLPNSEVEIPKPGSLQEMIRIAECLSKDIDFVRVDLYDTSEGVKFGELTSYPMSGLEKFKPDALNNSISSSWELKTKTKGWKLHADKTVPRE